jgi:alpha-ketoglutarate-dependent taurine dioxygenase
LAGDHSCKGANRALQRRARRVQRYRPCLITDHPRKARHPTIRLAGDVTVRTLDDAAAFTRNYKTARQPVIRDGVLRRLEGASTLEEERNAANAFRAWIEEEGILRL